MKKLLIGAPLIFSLPLLALSCGDYNSDEYKLIEKKNYANDLGDFSLAINPKQSKNLRMLNLATQTKLLRIGSQNQPVIDFRDNIVLQPSYLRYKFELLSNIEILQENGSNHLFNSDEIDQVSLDNASELQEDIFVPKKDKGNGFNLPYLFIPSSNKKSINNENFLAKLNLASEFKLNIKENQIPWVNYQNSKTKYFVSANDFKLGILRSLLQNKEFRKNYLGYRQEKEQDQNPYFNGINLYKFFIENNIDINYFLNNDGLSFKTLNNKNQDLVDFFKQLLIYSNYIDAIPYQYLFDKYQKDPFKDITWFYEYGKTYQDTLYSSYYLIKSNSLSEVKLEKNKYYPQSNNNLKNIDIQYNLIPINKQTFGSQNYYAFQQNIVSSLDYQILDNQQKNEMLALYPNINVSYYKNVEKYNLHNKLINNFLPTGKDQFFNDNFALLYYGLNKKELNENIDLKQVYKLPNFVFQSLINNLINQYALINANESIWLSQAPVDLDIKAYNKGLNYNYLADADVSINRPIILLSDNKEIYDIPQEENKTKIIEANSYDYLDRLKPVYFEEIKSSLQQIINEFYQSNKANKQDNISFVIPIVANNISQNQKVIIDLIPEIFKEVDSRFDVAIKYIEDLETYQTYFNKNRSIYKENTFTIETPNTQSFIVDLLTNFDNYLLYKMTLIANDFKNKEDVYKQTKQLINHLDENNINLSNLNDLNELNDYLKNNKNKIYLLLKEYISKLDLNDQINLINQINNLNSYILSLNNLSTVNTYKKVIYQKHIIKPVEYDGLNYLQDLKIQN
ncbi:hypothetical protein FJO69_02685 [[Mycoplasma] falconis]|uniref:Lipoprotein n=1 Tax=[Mycoplasma] falconis TaxID=92403 RepID=A0A501X989_9BACT|nr:hypothetical protein [[Mycoplasma] falconis]TPE56927.1 hypothetical protein FJO69_02685 [[Mycoplasma] falconis]